MKPKKKIILSCSSLPKFDKEQKPRRLKFITAAELLKMKPTREVSFEEMCR